MTIRVVHRPARTILPRPEAEPRLIEAPPALPEEGAAEWFDLSEGSEGWEEFARIMRTLKT